jgi:hypothetical protein
MKLVLALFYCFMTFVNSQNDEGNAHPIVWQINSFSLKFLYFQALEKYMVIRYKTDVYLSCDEQTYLNKGEEDDELDCKDANEEDDLDSQKPKKVVFYRNEQNVTRIRPDQKKYCILDDQENVLVIKSIRNLCFYGASCLIFEVINF